MPDKSILIVDGDCQFCLRWGERLRRWAAPSLEVRRCEPKSSALHPDLDFLDCLTAVQFIGTDGRLYAAAAAVSRALALRPGFGWVPFLYSLPILKQLAELAYKMVAANRKRCESCDY